MSLTTPNPLAPAPGMTPPALSINTLGGGGGWAKSPDRLADRQRAFREVLGRADAAGKAPETVARDAAEQFVAMTFVQPMLKGLRDSGGAAAPFAPTQAEKQFRGLLDADLARRIVGASNWPLVDRLARDLLQDQAPTATAAGEDA